jgi:hypothetical protein
MLAYLKRWPRGTIVAVLIVGCCMVAVYRASAFPGQSPPGFRDVPPTQPPVAASISRFPDDNRFIRPNDRTALTNQATGQMSGASGLAGGLSGLGGFGAGGGGGGGFFGQGRMKRFVPNLGNTANQDTFYGTFNFGGFKGYGFGGGDISAWRVIQQSPETQPALNGGASKSDSQ